ncbi:hypothetical protein BB559_000794 [Furculomyces boomerangus]|uniref:Uncharacterized protein n=1 Tax=Furculomyces boomerangus TaxID=61424 RepID=A0A2T9Z461_9FUNG|nr:hypothetical protein BB559_000794 [Furculomyces boomerangus]
MSNEQQDYNNQNNRALKLLSSKFRNSPKLLKVSALPTTPEIKPKQIIQKEFTPQKTIRTPMLAAQSVAALCHQNIVDQIEKSRQPNTNNRLLRMTINNSTKGRYSRPINQYYRNQQENFGYSGTPTRLSGSTRYGQNN